MIFYDPVISSFTLLLQANTEDPMQTDYGRLRRLQKWRKPASHSDHNMRARERGRASVTRMNAEAAFLRLRQKGGG